MVQREAAVLQQALTGHHGITGVGHLAHRRKPEDEEGDAEYKSAG